jgi:acyl carrier protein
MDPQDREQHARNGAKCGADGDQAAAGNGYVAPRTPVEQTLCRLWATFSLADRVGIHDDFFQAGGDSIAAGHLVARIRKAFSVEVPLARFFALPTVAATAACIEDALRGAAQDPSIPPIPRGDEQPASFAQERIWASDQLQEEFSLYNCPACLRLTGRLDVPTLERALNEILRRHEVLRSRFHASDGHVRLAIDPDLRLALHVEELPRQPDGTSATDVERMAATFLREPFDLPNGPLVRARLLRVGEQGHLLLLAFHHAVFDDPSTTLLFRELGPLYEAFLTGQPSPLPDLDVRYADFARWQRAQWSGEARDRLRSFWTTTLAGPLPALALPTSHERPVVQSFRCARVSMRLPEPLTAALSSLAHGEGATLFMVLLAAYQVLLARYSGQEDLLVGTPVDGRAHVETEGLIGCFVNSLVLRTNLSGNPTFLELLRRVRQAALDAYAHREMPYDQLVEELRPGRDPARAPVFQTVLHLRSSPAWKADVSGLHMQELIVSPWVSRLDLSLIAMQEPDGLACTFECSTDLFDQAAIVRLADHFRVLVESAVANPGRPIGELDLLPEAERRLVLDDWNATERAYPKDTCVHRLIEQVAATSPDRVALEHVDRRVTYADLNARANQLARLLARAHGVRPGASVGIFLDRTSEVVVAILAALKAGAAFLPLNPEAPQERLEFVLRDAGAAAVVTTAALAGRIESTGVGVTRVDADDDAISGEESDDLAVPDVSGRPAYQIYTSGSTGRPKGVLVSQLTGITRTDPPIYVGMTLLVTALGLLGCAAPAWRATRVDPIVTLRNE